MKGRGIPYSAEELVWIEERKELPRAEAHNQFCATWERDDVSLENFKALCNRRGWKTGRTGRFEIGQEAHNKGKPMSPETKAKVMLTNFKLGNVPHTYRGPGHESIDEDGYVYLIIADDNARTKTKTSRVLKHKHLWEQANGPVPEGYALKCLDGDRTNTDPANWQAIPRALLPRLAGGRGKRLAYDQASAEIKPALLTLAKLAHATKKARAGK